MQYWPSKIAAGAYDMGLDWAPALAELGDLTITGSTWSIISGDVVLSNFSFTTTKTAVRVSAGTAGSEAVVRNLVTLSNGEKYHEDAFLKVR